MDKEATARAKQALCKHPKSKRFKERRFDILNGFELITTRCRCCHRTLLLEVKKLKG